MAEICSISDCLKPHKAKGYCNSHYQRFCTHGDPLGGRTPEGEPLRFINEVALLYTSDDCLTWPFGKSSDGYGKIKIGGKNIIVSRYVCERVNGAPPTPDHEAAHSCGKGHEACISPIHLDWKTPSQNQADRIIHGTHSRGERNVRAKITDDEAREILALKGVKKPREIAERFGVSYQTVGHIHRQRSWAWLSKAEGASHA